MKAKDALLRVGFVEVLCQQWEESEAGWGVRPDGYSLHKDKDALERYVKAYWATMPKAVPAEYERPCGHPYPVYVHESVAARLAEKDGLRYYSGGSPEPKEVLEVSV
jgi:hypothetical protein